MDFAARPHPRPWTRIHESQRAFSKPVPFRITGAALLVAALLWMNACGLPPKPRYTPTAAGGSKATSVKRTARSGATENRAADSNPPGVTLTGQDFTLLKGDTLHARLANSIRAFLDARYKMGGQDTKAADCSGFVMAVFRQAFGVDLPHNASEMFSLGEPIAADDLRAGDLVFFENPQRRVINHVGIYLSERRFVHSTVSAGVTLSSLMDGYWQERYVGGRRLP